MQKKSRKFAFLIGMCMIILISIMSCPPGDDNNDPPAAPSDLEVTNTSPCTIEWTDNSDNEDGFNIYLGTPCTDCENTENWILYTSVDENIEIYEWGESCCGVAECSCVKVEAFNDYGAAETGGIMLAPVCK